MVKPVNNDKTFFNYYAIHALEADTKLKKIEYAVGGIALGILTLGIYPAILAFKEKSDRSSSEHVTLFRSEGELLENSQQAKLYEELIEVQSLSKGESEKLKDPNLSKAEEARVKRVLDRYNDEIKHIQNLIKQ